MSLLRFDSLIKTLNLESDHKLNRLFGDTSKTPQTAEQMIMLSADF